jgi:intraflagellar transport protein 46
MSRRTYDDDDGDFSDGLEEFEESVDETNFNKRNDTKFKDKPYDEAVEFSQDLSVNESYDARAKQVEKERKLKNDKYDEAIDVSQSMDQSGAVAKPIISKPNDDKKDSKTVPTTTGKPQMSSLPEEKTNSFTNKPFDEALEFSQSNSDESVDTRGSHGKSVKRPKETTEKKQPASMPMNTTTVVQNQKPNVQGSLQAPEDSGSEESDGEVGVSQQNYDNIEGVYNPKDFMHLNVSAEIKDLFQYIERYRAQPMELETSLKCFIPDYIPAIGEMDAFIKIPRPDGKEDELGLKRLDEPAAIQSDPTVLELQLRAMTKKQQYGDVAVRSIENAEKSPLAIDKWINNINELHRTKPPPQVHYHRNMPDIESLMEVWPDGFEAALGKIPLPPPDLDLTLPEYVRILCSILDIPVYENPIESLHVMFTLFTDFRNNPHFQAMQAGNEVGDNYKQQIDYGSADVLQLDGDADYK